MQPVELDLLAFELALSFIRSSLLLLFFMGDLLQGHLGPWKAFFLDLPPLLKILDLVSLVFELLYFCHEMLCASCN